MVISDQRGGYVNETLSHLYCLFFVHKDFRECSTICKWRSVYVVISLLERANNFTSIIHGCSLLFFKTKIGGARSIKECLNLYVEALGQIVNYDTESIQKIFNIQITEGHAIYLGLPTSSNRNKRLQFGFLRERVTRKLETWKNKHLSAAEKKFSSKLLCRLSLTTRWYIFKVLEAICSDIDRACPCFWWGDSVEIHKMHWKKWEALCYLKER